MSLIVKNLKKSYKNRLVLEGISLEIKRGTAIALLGPNGAGKTTCFYAIAGLVRVDSGEIHLDDKDVTHLPMHRRARLGLGYLPQEPSVFRGLTVEKNIEAILETKIRDKALVDVRLDALLSEFSIMHLRRMRATSLSGGERRRVEIARALANDPKFLLLDEPFAGVDPIAISDIRYIVSHLKDKNIGIVITDHNVRETLRIVDKAYILHDGHILAVGTPDEIFENPEVQRVYLGENFEK